MSRRSELFRRMDEIERAKNLSERPEFNAAVVRRAKKRMDRADALPTDIRRVVHEYGLEVVQEFLNHGVRRPESIAHLIDTARDAEYRNGQVRFKVNKGPAAKRNPINYEPDDDDRYYVPRTASR